MKNTKMFLVGALLGVISVGQVSAASLISVGEGEDRSFLILDTPATGFAEFEVFFDFDSVNPLGLTDLLQIIENNEPNFSFEASNAFGTPEQPNEFLVSVTFNGGEQVSTDDEFFAFFGAGGQTGVEVLFDDLGNFTGVLPDPEPIPFGEFTLTDGLSAPFRIIEPGSTDAIIFGPFGVSPSFEPIPEPTATMLLSSLCLFAVRRRRQS